MTVWITRVLLSLSLISGGYIHSSQAQELGVQDVSAETALAICSYVRNNDTRALKQKLQHERKRLRDIYGSITCNNFSLIQFALRYNAHDVGRFLAMSATPLSIEQAGDLEWADTNNQLDTPTGAVLNERMECVRRSSDDESCSQRTQTSTIRDNTIRDNIIRDNNTSAYLR